MVPGRLICGVGVGFISAIVILYMSEIAPKAVRGAVVAGYQFCITIGILLANCVVYATQDRRDTGSYRIPIAVQFLWGIILALGLFFLPESPRYFVKKGKLELAAKALSSVRGRPIDSDYIKDELAEIVANHEYELQVNSGGTGMVIMLFIVGIVGVTAGRESQHNNSAVSAMIAFICFNISFFAATWGPCAWVVIGEIFPLPIRSRGVGLSTSSNWFWNCIIATITPSLVGTEKGQADLGAKVFFLWRSLCCFSTLFAYFLVPETKGLSLEQVDQMLEETNPRHSAKWLPHKTFASEMGLTNKGLSISAPAGEIHEALADAKTET
ncbi:MAG: hypothetical protein Q9166_004134 [cf. Caloplaca sp. 2 TL-2023]